MTWLILSIPHTRPVTSHDLDLYILVFSMGRNMEVKLVELPTLNPTKNLYVGMSCTLQLYFSDSSDNGNQHGVHIAEDGTVTSYLNDDGSVSYSYLRGIITKGVPLEVYNNLCPRGGYTSEFLNLKYNYSIDEYTSLLVDRASVSTTPIKLHALHILEFFILNSSMSRFQPFTHAELDHFMTVEGHTNFLYNMGFDYNWDDWNKLIIASANTEIGNSFGTPASYQHYIHYPNTGFIDLDKFHIHRVNTGRIYEYATSDYIKAYNEFDVYIDR